ncbi:heavy metal-associated isoprenylated plant protein 7-like [Andrographis paniculata]|uniref:heavy metal-associated isoprenylated plant protein 7-like n=1 Tax=Andrographis paniculata TaxID=175694 RepID=UPI0021E6E542|nr:heavy metal-associated isoprenylated plant protein 7-like [Andrographis paniculata]
MGEEKKEELGNKEEEGEKKKKEEEEEEKKEEEIVLRVEMHCEACARKVIRALKGFQGVEEVMADYRSSRVVVKAVKNSTDPIKLCQRIHKKTGRKVGIISPLPTPPSTDQENPKPEEEEPKQEPPAPITVVLKVQMHCEACAQALQKKIGKIKGVESVATNIASNEVTVKGVIDPENLVNDVYKRTHKHASIVKNEEKKEEEKKKKEEEEEEEQKKKEEEEKKQQKKKDEEEDAKLEVKKMEFWGPKQYMEYAYAPQLFSDENPNACSVM